MKEITRASKNLNGANRFLTLAMNKSAKIVAGKKSSKTDKFIAEMKRNIDKKTTI